MVGHGTWGQPAGTITDDTEQPTEFLLSSTNSTVVMHEFPVDEIDERTSSRIIKSAVTPRPIGWISTTSPDGVDNLAPFSCYNYISSEHPVVMFSSKAQSDGEHKDTARNALETTGVDSNEIHVESFGPA